MKSTLWWLGLIFGTLSVVMLIKHGLEVSFVSSLQVVLEYYEQAMRVLFGWAEPWIREQLVALGAWLGLDLHLHPHWKHVFVLMWLYLSRDPIDSFRGHKYAPGSIGTAAFQTILAVFAALLAGVGAGAIPLVSSDLATSFAIVSSPVLANAVFEIVDNTRRLLTYLLRSLRPVSEEIRELEERFRQLDDDLRRQLSRRPTLVGAVLVPIRRAIIAMAFVVVVLTVPTIQTLPNPGIAALMTTIVMAAAAALLTGVWQTNLFMRMQRQLGQVTGSWVEEYLVTGGARIGLAILTVALGSALFLATNAGLKLAGIG